MKIGLAFDLKPTVGNDGQSESDESEEYDPPETIDALASEIMSQGHQVVYLGGGRAFLENVLRADVDFVFNIAEGRGNYRGREAQTPSVLEMLGVLYSGSDPLTLSICLDKPSAKLVAVSAGVNTPKFKVIDNSDDLLDFPGAALEFPLVVKPAFEGSSKGVNRHSRVETVEELHRVVRSVLQTYRQPALLEEFVAGIEVTAGIVGNAPPQVVGLMEIVPRRGPDENFMYTLEVKREWREEVRYRCPPELPSQCVDEIQSAALRLFKALGCRDAARLDFRVDRNHKVWFIEANPLPGLSEYSDLPIMASLCGWTYPNLVNTILAAGLKRCGLQGAAHANRITV